MKIVPDKAFLLLIIPACLPAIFGLWLVTLSVCIGPQAKQTVIKKYQTKYQPENTDLFHINSRSESDYLSAPYPKELYNLVSEGDVFYCRVTGIYSVHREGKRVARLVTKKFYISVLITSITFFPLIFLIFLLILLRRFENKLLRRVSYFSSGILSILIIVFILLSFTR